MSDMYIKIVFRWDVENLKNKSFKEGVEFYKKYLDEVEDIDENDNWFMYKGKYQPKFINNKWFLDVVLKDDYSYNVETFIMNDETLKELYDELRERFGGVGLFPGRLIFCHYYNGSDCPLDVEEF